MIGTFLLAYLKSTILNKSREELLIQSSTQFFSLKTKIRKDLNITILYTYPTVHILLYIHDCTYKYPAVPVHNSVANDVAHEAAEDCQPSPETAVGGGYASAHSL